MQVELNGQVYRQKTNTAEGSIRKWNIIILCQAIGQFRKRLASIIAMKGSHVQHYVQVFNTTTLHCNDQVESFPELSYFSTTFANINRMQTLPE